MEGIVSTAAITAVHDLLVTAAIERGLLAPTHTTEQADAAIERLLDAEVVTPEPTDEAGESESRETNCLVGTQMGKPRKSIGPIGTTTGCRIIAGCRTVWKGKDATRMLRYRI